MSVLSTQKGTETQIHLPNVTLMPDCSNDDTASTFCRLEIGVIMPTHGQEQVRSGQVGRLGL
jgi:hypothetical protein